MPRKSLISLAFDRGRKLKVTAREEKFSHVIINLFGGKRIMAKFHRIGSAPKPIKAFAAAFELVNHINTNGERKRDNCPEGGFKSGVEGSSTIHQRQDRPDYIEWESNGGIHIARAVLNDDGTWTATIDKGDRRKPSVFTGKFRHVKSLVSRYAY